MVKKIIVDSSPLIAFGRIDQISLISHLAGEIIIPPSVAEECIFDVSRPGGWAIQKAINANLIVIQELPEFANQQNLTNLDKGEMEAILLSSHLNILLLIDEKLGRQVAKQNGCNIIGTGGILIAAKRANLIDKVAPFVEKLQRNGYYLSKKLRTEILRKAGE